MVSWVLIVQIYEDFATEQNPNGTIFTSGQALTRRCGVLETSPSFLIHLTWATRQENLSHLKWLSLVQIIIFFVGPISQPWVPSWRGAAPWHDPEVGHHQLDDHLHQPQRCSLLTAAGRGDAGRIWSTRSNIRPGGEAKVQWVRWGWQQCRSGEQSLQPPNFSSEILSKIWVNYCISE